MKSYYRLLYVLSVLLCFNAQITHAQTKVLGEEELLLQEADMQWFRDAKFGMFIHWGLYSILGQGEWAMFNKRIDVDEYAKLSEQFTAKKYNADVWADVAESAGMKYMVMVAKHHDGFALWDSKASANGFNSINSAAKKDFIAEYVTAARKRNLKVGLYYSPLDWRFPGFFFPDMYQKSAEEMKTQTYGQIKELLSNYGQIDLLWYDGGEDNWLGHGGIEFGGSSPSWHVRPKDKPYKGSFSWEPLKLNSMVRELQPKIVINPRSGWKGDFDTREKEDGGMQTDRPWERCYTISKGGWGWKPNAKVRPLDSLVKKLVKVVCMDGNLLLNVGPNAAGEIEPEQVARLKEMGAWLKINGESIYGTRGGPIAYNESWGGTTTKDNFIYLHVMKWSKNGQLEIPYKGRKIVKANYLANGKKAQVSQDSEKIIINNPNQISNGIDTVIKLQLK
ncbi:MAG TPA: alpha-L-fucosidase [Pelobium sp.]|nr:alpha-L-fucosidase [Pelobium sp.]